MKNECLPNPYAWKYLGTTTGINALTLPSDYTELYVTASCQGVTFNSIIIKEITGDQIIVGGYYATTTSGGANIYGASCSILKSVTSIRLQQIFINGTSVTSDSTLKVYYR